MKKRLISFLICVLLCMAVLCVPPAAAEDDHPIRMAIVPDPETELAGEGTISYLTFTLTNAGDVPYTLYDAHLSGGYDGVERTLNGEITIEAGGTREFTLRDVPVSDDQLDTDVVYTLMWTERIEIAPPSPGDTAGRDPDDVPAYNEDEWGAYDPTATPRIEEAMRKTRAVVRVERFLPPELTVTASVESTTVTAGETFTVTYRVANDTKFDMTGLKLTDPDVYEGTLPLPATELTAGSSFTIAVDYTMEEVDMLFCPIVSYIAAQRPTETRASEIVTVASVTIGVRIDVQQYPSNEDGTTFAITVTNTGNRSMRRLQLYDEINTPIEKPFDLGPQQQKVLTFNVPSAASAGLVRTVRFRVSGTDFFNNDFTFIDTNSYDCIPYIASDAVRLSLLVTLSDAYYDPNGKLCGQIQFEIRNYSDVHVKNAVLSELTLFGDVQQYDELQRGETFYTVVYQLDGVEKLAFRVTAFDPTGKMYSTETITLNLEQLPTLAERTEQRTIIYHSNTFLKDLADKIAATLTDVVRVVMILAVISGILCIVLWFAEVHITSRIPRDSLLQLRVPDAKKPVKATMDHVLSGSPAEQLGYTAPAKLRYAGESTARKLEAHSGEETQHGALFSTAKQRTDTYWAVPQGTPDRRVRERLPRPAATLAEFLAEPKQREDRQRQTRPVRRPQKPAAEQPIAAQPAAEPAKQKPVFRKPAAKPKAKPEKTAPLKKAERVEPVRKTEKTAAEQKPTPIEQRKPLQPIEQREAPKPIERIEPIEAVERIEPIETVERIEPIIPIEPTPEPVAVIETQPEPEPEPIKVIEPEPIPESEPVAAVEPESEPEHESVIAVEPEPEPEPVPEPVEVIEPALEPEPVAAVESEPAPIPAPIAAVPEPVRAPSPRVLEYRPLPKRRALCPNRIVRIG